jgi:glycosyltransferase involved in cell wall biosynthesis
MRRSDHLTMLKGMPSLLRDTYRRIRSGDGSRVIHLPPSGSQRGSLLLSYILHPFFHDPSARETSHTNEWECRQIARIFQERGFAVDVIDFRNSGFVPKKRYSVFIDIHSNMERLAQPLGANCLKVLHITGSHWLFQNSAEYSRLFALQQRRGVTLVPRRIVPPSLAIEACDCATILGNDVTQRTFGYAKKPLYPIPVSTINQFEFNEQKDFERYRSSYLWLGGSGMVHKGLDLVLETFAKLPEYTLTVCGPVKNEPDFLAAYRRELTETPNITTVGWVALKSDMFKRIIDETVAVIYPSCSEGQASSVVACLHAGLIPIVSAQSGVDVGDFGTILTTCTSEEMRSAIERLSALPAVELQARSRKAWTFARSRHTRDRFAREYAAFVDSVVLPSLRD